VKASTKYAWKDGVSIAYQVFGDGKSELVFTWGPATHVEHMWDQPNAVRLFDRLASFARVLIFDRRGMGASDPTAGPPTLEQQADDMLTVMDAAGFERPFIYGETNASRMAALFAATHPGRLSGLILYASSAVGSEMLTPPLELLLLELVEKHWGEGETAYIFAPSVADQPNVKEWFGSAERYAAPPGVVRKLIEMDASVDVRSVLPAIRVPTLVLHRAGDPLVPLELGRRVADAIPNATFVELEGDDNMSFFGDSDAILEEIEQFVTGERHHHYIDRVLTTLLFTDIVESTKRAAALGDRPWRDLLEHHYGQVRTEVSRFGGRQIRTLGDGFLGTFDGPARAIRCGCAIADTARGLGIDTRAGLHTGEVEILEDDLAGLAVHIGARVVAEAQPGEVLVSGTVKDLVAGSGLTFTDRGERHLKGVPGTWRLYAVER
jgi:class 3 adenylate cyclase